MLKKTGIFDSNDRGLEIAADPIQLHIFSILFTPDDVKWSLVNIKKYRIVALKVLNLLKFSDHTRAE